GSESVACFAKPHSPWSLPFAPPTPWRIAPLCSPASQLLWQGQTSRVRASSATAPPPPPADRPPPPTPHVLPHTPPPPQRSLCTWCGLRPRQGDSTLHNGAAHVAFGRIKTLGPCDV